MAPPIKPKLAEIVNNRFSSILPLEQLKQKDEKHLQPENCDKLIVPECNKVIKDLLHPGMVTHERHFQYIQLGLTNAACAITKVVNDLLEPTS